MENIPADERESISAELVDIVNESLVKRHGFTIPQARRKMYEILSVSI